VQKIVIETKIINNLVSSKCKILRFTYANIIHICKSTKAEHSTNFRLYLLLYNTHSGSQLPYFAIWNTIFIFAPQWARKLGLMDGNRWGLRCFTKILEIEIANALLLTRTHEDGGVFTTIFSSP